MEITPFEKVIPGMVGYDANGYKGKVIQKGNLFWLISEGKVLGHEIGMLPRQSINSPQDLLTLKK